MRINNILSIVAAFSLLLSGCGREDAYLETTVQASRPALSLRVNAAAYHPSIETRAIDAGITTTFAYGDQLALIVTHPGNSVEHLVYTYDGSTWIGSGPGSVYYDSQASYAAYYPYKEALRGKPLSEVKSAFTPLTDQSDYATGYAASDLMTCESATLDKTSKTLSITLTHAFSMLRFPVDVPVKSKCEDGNTYEYSVSATDVVFYIGDTPYRAWMGSDGYARLIVSGSSSNNDNITVKSSYTFFGKRVETSGTVSSFVPGRYYTLTPPATDLGEYKFSDARVGDYYCRNSSGEGYLIPNEAESLPAGTNCIGIVYWLGDIKGDNYGLLDSKFPSGTHGLVVSLWDMPAPDDISSVIMTWTYGGCEYVNHWLGSNNGIACTWSGRPSNFTSIQVTDKMQGYANTLALIEYNTYVEGQTEEGYGQNGNKRVKPVKGLAAFQDAHPAPSNSSGWYWPSVYELKYVCWGQGNGQSTSGKNMLNTKIGKLGGNTFVSDRYWSSTEYSDYSDDAWFVDFNNGYVYDYGLKYYSPCRVRPLLAF